MKIQKYHWPVVFFALFAFIYFIVVIAFPTDATGRPPLGVTNLDSLHLSDTGGTSQPVLKANQKGTGKIVEFLDNGTPVWSLSDGGAISGNQTIEGARDAATGTDYFLTVEGNNDGLVAGAKTYGLYIDMEREAGDITTGGDLDDAGMKIRVTNKMTSSTAGNTLRGFDVSAKNDNDDGTITNLIGGLVSIQTDTGAGDVNVAKAMEINTTVNAPVTDTLMVIDIRHFRQTAIEPTQEIGVRIRNSSTTGTGADAALWIDSDGTAPTNNWDYAIDISGADINTADLRLENGETISNQTDTVIQISSFFAFEEGTTQDLGATFIITPTASYQPITNSTGGSITSSATTAIADGPIPGTWLFICNEDAQDMVVKDGANTKIGGDITLTGGADDCLTVVWNGADWVGQAFHDN